MLGQSRRARLPFPPTEPALRVVPRDVKLAQLAATRDDSVNREGVEQLIRHDDPDAASFRKLLETHAVFEVAQALPGARACVRAPLVNRVARRRKNV
jgi:hypothetical protein